MKRICVDMDEVMADTLGEHLRRYNDEFGEAVTREELYGKGLWEVVSTDRQSNLRAYLDDEAFFADLPVFPDARQVLESLSQRFDIYIATQAMSVPSSFRAKYQWLQRHFPFLPPSRYVYCGDKGILRADYLIDDLPRNLVRFEGKGILYSAPHNMTVTGFDRVSNWREVAEYFRDKE